MKIFNIGIEYIKRILFDDFDTPALNKKCEQPEELQTLLNNADENSNLIIDRTEKSKQKSRLEDKDVQTAIQKFNRLSKEEKIKILDNADAKLHEKLLTFVERKSKFENVSQNTRDTFNKLSNKMSEIYMRDYYDEDEIDEIWNGFKNTILKCNECIEYVHNSFTEYRGEVPPENKHVSLLDNINYAIAKSSNIKQTIQSYSKLIKSKIRDIYKQAPNDKCSVMRDILATTARLQTITETYQSDTSELMEKCITEAVNEENQFSTNVIKYASTGIPKDLSLKNKIMENIMIDTIVEATNYKGTSLY